MRTFSSYYDALFENFKDSRGTSSALRLPPLEYDQGALSREWLTTKEAAEYLRISPASLGNMVSNGTIKPSGKLGKLNRFRLDDLRELLSAKPKKEISYGN